MTTGCTKERHTCCLYQGVNSSSRGRGSGGTSTAALQTANRAAVQSSIVFIVPPIAKRGQLNKCKNRHEFCFHSGVNYNFAQLYIDCRMLLHGCIDNGQTLSFTQFIYIIQGRPISTKSCAASLGHPPSY